MSSSSSDLASSRGKRMLRLIPRARRQLVMQLFLLSFVAMLGIILTGWWRTRKDGAASSGDVAVNMQRTTTTTNNRDDRNVRIFAVADNDHRNGGGGGIVDEVIPPTQVDLSDPYEEIKDDDFTDDVSSTTTNEQLVATSQLGQSNIAELFGQRGQYRAAHLQARLRGRFMSSSPPSSSIPVLDDPGTELIPFHENLVQASFRQLPRLEIEGEYFRFEDEFGLIDTGWTDEQIRKAMQSLADIWAQANIRVRIRVDEAIARVRLSRIKALAYLYYTDYPKGDLTLMPDRAKRKAFLDTLIPQELISLIRRVDRERQGLFDWIMGWPEERTPWENINVVGIYPVFYYFYMNGGGERGCMRFRTGDCNSRRRIRGTDHVIKCQGFDRANRYGDTPFVIRSHERKNFTIDMAVRLVAHEMGHALGLQHPPIPGSSPAKYCKSYASWNKGDLMAQVRAITVSTLRCRPTGYPELASRATFLSEATIRKVRSQIKTDLRETPTVRGSKRVGDTVELLSLSANPILIKEESSVAAQAVQQHAQCIEMANAAVGVVFLLKRPSQHAGSVVKRIRWKSGRDFTKGDTLRVAIISCGDDDVGTIINQVTIHPHDIGKHVHQEHDVDLTFSAGGQCMAIMSGKDGKPFMPEMRLYEDRDALVMDVVAGDRLDERRHPLVNEVMSRIDPHAGFPEAVGISKGIKDGVWGVLVPNGGGSYKMTRAVSCPRMIFNYDVFG